MLSVLQIVSVALELCTLFRYSELWLALAVSRPWFLGQ